MNNSFSTLTKSDTLTSNTIYWFNIAFNDQATPVLSCLSSMGYDVSEVWNSMEECLFDYGTPIANLNAIFNNAEANMSYVQSVLDFKSPFYKDFGWEINPKNIKQNVDRWIDWNNSFKEILDGANANTQPLVISGELTRDKNGEIIYVGVI